MRWQRLPDILLVLARFFFARPLCVNHYKCKCTTLLVARDKRIWSMTATSKASQMAYKLRAVAGASAVPGDCHRANDANQLDDVLNPEWRHLLPGVCGS